MPNLNQSFPSSEPVFAPNGARELYLAMRDNPELGRTQARAYLEAALAAVRHAACDLPSDPSGLYDWCTRHTARVGQAYRQYLNARQRGGARQYFPTKAAALHFIRGAAPTKLVDGSWLYASLQHWGDGAYHGLVRTYLEELGDGIDDKNHVLLYHNLLARHGCDQWDDLPEDNFVQGAIQLALAVHGADMLPEMVGFNLGYEQLPLHLLITSYELNELCIDPYYFTLHVTVDNASTGHARRAIDAVRQLMARADDPQAFWQRVVDGYKLNDLGASTTSIIGSFDLQDELVRILSAKAAAGEHMHSDYCKVGGKSINAWLAEPAGMAQMLQALEDAGWITRGQDAAESRFWGLVSGPRAQMFGVFSGYELQVLRDWIEHDPAGSAAPARIATFRARQRASEAPARPLPAKGATRGLIRQHGPAANDGAGECNALRRFEGRLADAGGKREMMELLIAELSPARHHTPTGLMATRIFARLLDA